MRSPAGCGVLAMLAFAIAGSDSRAEDGSQIYLKGLKSCVMVRNLDRGVQGSGSVVNLRGGYVVTNWHVVRNGSKMMIVFPMWEKDRPVVEANKYQNQLTRIGLLGEVVASDPKVDLAVIKLVDPTKMPKSATAVKFAADSPLAGSKIHSIGNPGASDAMWVYTPGDVRAVYKKQWLSVLGPKTVGEHDAKIIEATSPTSPGDSGGPCFNDKAEQIGVTQGGLRSSVAQGYSYFIDSSEVKTFLKTHKIAFSLQSDQVKKEPEPKSDGTTTGVDTSIGVKVGAVDEEKARQEKSAATILNLVRPLTKDPSKRSFTTTKLRDLIKSYPKTEAAKEAQEILQRIE